MENQFSRIGQLIYDMEAGVFICETDVERFMNDEFREITLRLASHWYNKDPGLQYLLEFHREECERLLRKVQAMYGLFVNLGAFREGRELMKVIYLQLIDQLGAMGARIDKMIFEPASKALAGFKLN